MNLEKVVITGSLQKGLTKKGNPFYTVTLADGRQATCFDQKLAQTLNQEVEAEVKQTEYNGAIEYILNPPNGGAGKRGSGFNLEFNQRKTALEAAAQSMGIGSNDGGDILRRADKFLEWMQK